MVVTLDSQPSIMSAAAGTLAVSGQASAQAALVVPCSGPEQLWACHPLAIAVAVRMRNNTLN